MPTNTGFDSESGRKAGLASAQARRKKKDIRADLRARAKFEQSAEDLASVLIQAALGKDEFKNLSPKERAVFAIKALEYGVGKPRQVEPGQMQETEPAAGLVFTQQADDTSEPAV